LARASFLNVRISSATHGRRLIFFLGNNISKQDHTPGTMQNVSASVKFLVSETASLKMFPPFLWLVELQKGRSDAALCVYGV
jgi:hypothetical protein